MRNLFKKAVHSKSENEARENSDLPAFSMFQTSHIPFKTETRSYVLFLNKGRESKGVYLYFLGGYVENDDITFSDVKINDVPVELEKAQLSDGQWAFRAHCPEIKIPAIDKKLKGSKLVKAQYEKCITAHFVPHGNQRKTLDITVVLIPEENWSGPGYYYAWHGYSSKTEYIRGHNAHILERDLPEFFLMNEDDYDL